VIETHEHNGNFKEPRSLNSRTRGPLKLKGGCVRAVLGTLPCAFRSTEWDDVIVDVHEKTTTIEVRILDSVYPRVDSLGKTVGSHGCLQHLWLSKNLAFALWGRVRAPRKLSRAKKLSSPVLGWGERPH